MGDCKHCRNGWFDDQRFGADVECVNGVLIDIDEAHEGWQRDVVYPVAPCHPMWSRQQAGDEDFPNDCQERLETWASLGTEDDHAAPEMTDPKAHPEYRVEITEDRPSSGMWHCGPNADMTHEQRNAAILRKIEAYTRRVTATPEAAREALDREAKMDVRHPKDVDRR